VESARLQAALDNATDGVWEYDYSTRKGRRSSAQLHHLGYDADAVNAGNPAWTELIHPDDLDRVNALIDRNARHSAPHHELVYRVRAFDGSWHTIVDRGRVTERTDDGKPKVIFGISADITERQRADEAREESDRRFRVIFESAQQFQALLDTDGTLLEVNAAALTMAGVTSDDVVGRVIVDGPWWRDLPDARDIIMQRFMGTLGGKVIRFELATRFAQGRSGVLDFSFTPLFDADGTVVQVLAEGRDVTERRRAEEALREIGALTTMGRLAARVAHEINNPLAGIQNSFLLLADAIPTDHPHYRFVGAIEREIQRIAVVTRQLYETYRPDQSSTANSSVVLAVTDAVTFLDQVNRGRGVRIVTDVTRAPSSIPIPDALLRQTLYNLVQNAVEASPINGVVTVTAARDGDSCVIVVRDEGAGIAPHLRERIFDPFFSTKDSKVKTSGMGLGLALVKQSVEAVGGTIHLVESLDVGATFEVRLPMTPVTRVAGEPQGAGMV
jgi:PAS domain S-box-containing protein